MRFHKILVAVDFSAPSREAMRTAAGLAAEVDAELVIVHVMQQPIAGAEAAISAAAMEDVITASNRLIGEWVTEAHALGARRAASSMRSGVPWNEIVDAVQRDPSFDLVVLGSYGRSGIKHALLGSVAEKVVRHARCAVLVVRPPS